MKKFWKPKRKPQIGDRRTRRVFLLFPITEHRETSPFNETRWLERATVEERLSCFTTGQESIDAWEFIRFVD
jgi:hypothetical protein